MYRNELDYGSELLDLARKVAGPMIDLDRKYITFYIDNNNNDKMALIKSDSKRRIIATPARVFWDIATRRAIIPRFGRPPTDFNIVDKHKRKAELPYRVKNDRVFLPTRTFYGWSLRLCCIAISGPSIRMR